MPSKRNSHSFDTVQVDPAAQNVDPVHPMPPHCPYFGTAIGELPAIVVVADTCVVNAEVVGFVVVVFAVDAAPDGLDVVEPEEAPLVKTL